MDGKEDRQDGAFNLNKILRYEDQIIWPKLIACEMLGPFSLSLQLSKNTDIVRT